MSAYCPVFAGALSFDFGPPLTRLTGFGAAQLLLLGGSVAVAGWNIRRARVSRLSLDVAMATLCGAWILCGLLRAEDAPRALVRITILLPLLAALSVLVAGLPLLHRGPSRFHKAATAAAAAVLLLLPMYPRTFHPARIAAPTARTPPSRRSTVLIVLDTFRRDHMSLYGYARKTTPALDARARTGIVYDAASAVASWTLPSHASMFTGRWPRSHGADTFRGEKGLELNYHPLARESLTLAEIAREHGYRTAGLVANHGFLSPVWGLDQGFEEYLCRRPRLAGLQLRTARALALRWDARRAWHAEMPYVTAPELTRATIAWLERNRETPFFLFLNYMDAHLPNAAPTTSALPLEDETPPRRGGFFSYAFGAPISPAERRGLVNEYDREAIHLDHWVGVLLDHLERSGLGARTQVILTSDHGELLGEHDLVGHGKSLHAPMVEVPLIVWEPGAQAGRDSRPVQGLDLFPTILRYLQLPVPPGTQGQPLQEVEHPTVSELYYANGKLLASRIGHRFDRITRRIQVGEYVLHESSSGERQLFNRTLDPGEAHDLMAERPDIADAARASLADWLRRTPEAQTPADAPHSVDGETLESLRTLGYVQ